MKNKIFILLVLASLCAGILAKTFQNNANAQLLDNLVIKGASDEDIEKLLTRPGAVDVRDDRKRTPLHWAAIWGRSAQAEELLSKGADIMARDYKGNTPLHYAVQFDTNLADRLIMIEKLLFYGADIYEHNGEGYSPIELSYSFFIRKMLLDFAIGGGVVG